jgi:hypothetical protein
VIATPFSVQVVGMRTVERSANGVHALPSHAEAAGQVSAGGAVASAQAHGHQPGGGKDERHFQAQNHLESLSNSVGALTGLLEHARFARREEGESRMPTMRRKPLWLWLKLP